MLANAVASLFVKDQADAPQPRMRGTDSVLNVWEDYVQGLQHTPSMDTVPEWMRVDDDDNASLVTGGSTPSSPSPAHPPPG